MRMFCYQCQETATNTGCTKIGVCGKKEDIAVLQDLTVYMLKGIGLIVTEAGIDPKEIPHVNHALLESLFITITNANFDGDSIEKNLFLLMNLRDELKKKYLPKSDFGALSTVYSNREDMLDIGRNVGVLATENEDIRSLREMITYGLKGMAAYTHHAYNLKKENHEIYDFMYKALSKITKELPVDELVQLTLETGENSVKAMALLDEANTSTYGNPEVTNVNIGVNKNPGILISGHDLTDLEQLLEQTKDAGVDVYTHSEMLPAHSYPAFKKYPHFVGNYGNAWWKQIEEFKTFNGPILFTTNCIVPPRDESVTKRIFTTGATGFPGCKHIDSDDQQKKDFKEIIELAKTLPAPDEIEKGHVIGGFAHHQVLALADKVVEAVNSGAIKKFFVMAGCDGRMPSRKYYTDFAEALPQDTVILTAGCAKYRYNKLPLGDIGGIPRVLDAGQCNDSYSLALVALKLKEVFGLEDVNELPIEFNIAWYEQKAVCVLLALLSLGFKNIHLGPTLPGFLSPNVANVLVETFGIKGVGDVQSDIQAFMA